MLEKTAFDTVIEILKPECFYVESHQRIYQAMSIPGPEKPADRHAYRRGRAPVPGRTGNDGRTLLYHPAHEFRLFLSPTLTPMPGSSSK